MLELVVGSDDQERKGLARRKQLRMLAPQSNESPIYFHLSVYNATDSTVFREVSAGWTTEIRCVQSELQHREVQISSVHPVKHTTHRANQEIQRFTTRLQVYCAGRV